MSIIYEKRDRTAYITLNRPEKRNAIDLKTARDLGAALNDFRNDDDLWVAVLTGAGDKAFSSGADLESSIPNLTGRSSRGETLPEETNTVMDAFHCWKPLIAAVNGFCFAGGMELMLACDLRIASEKAVFGLTEVRWGLIPAGGGTQRLPRTVPLAKAMEMTLLGDTITAEEALQMGLINKVVPHHALGEEVDRWVRTLTANGPLALRAAKQAILQGLDLPLQQGFSLEQQLFRELLKTEDAVEGPNAFQQGRKPDFKGH